ncbi:AAA domain-containing protein [Rhizobium mongolense]|uniref:AAA domain-containing protein n=1 Tax=Rhizobium mongolense TaxID=57676 RepID=UPI003556F2C9
MKKQKNQKFLDKYVVTRRLMPGDKFGRPTIWEATDPHGAHVFVREWVRKRGQDDQDLEDIWRSEIRQLHSLAALPSANDLIARLVASGKDSDGFYLVIDGGDEAPLHLLLTGQRKPLALASHRMPQFRNLIWRNFRRIVEGVSLLHSQGTLHRNIDPWSIMTNFSPKPDFRLTGFEWSMRIAKTAESASGPLVSAARTRESSSFHGDWADLAFLISTVLEIPAQRLADMRLVPSEVTDHTSAAEIRLLRSLMGLIPVDRLDGDWILQQMDVVITHYAADASKIDAHLYLALALGPNSKLTSKVRRASGNSMDVSETDKQIDFIHADLGPTPLMVSVKDEFGAISYQLGGTYLNYQLRPWQQRASTEAPNWEFALCDDADTEPPLPVAVVSSLALNVDGIEFSDRRDSYAQFPRLRGKTLSWDTQINALRTVGNVKTDEEEAHQAMSLLFLLELAYAAANIFPIRVTTRIDDALRGDVYRIQAKSIVDEGREKLSDALKLIPPAKRLSQILESGELREENGWMLLEEGELGETLQMTQWRLVDSEKDDEGYFELEGSKPPQVTGDAYLTQAEAGTIVQLKRRLKALAELGKHSELLEMLTDQRGRIDDSQDKLDTNDEQFGKLDVSKQEALKDIFGTIPLFLLQGPPGVGKTYVVSEIVRRRLLEESTARFLLTAQSNSAIDHLMDEITPLFKETKDPPLIVRARSVEDERKSEGYETEHLAADVVADLAYSKLFSEGSDSVRRRISELAEEYAGQLDQNRTRKKGKTSADKRAIESMILRSANLVFATTNSAAVETLIQDRGLFDWTIVEEAGKATGSELISPLLLSYRRLMIGDHMQLPPFDSERVEKILADPATVSEAIKAVEDMISRQLKDASLDDLLDDVKSEGIDLPRVCALALEFLKMFGSFVEKDYKFVTERPRARRIARRLSEQHRMHPAISRIVSHCFYDDELHNYATKEREFQTTASPVVLDVGREDTPVTFIDMPYSRAEARNGKFSDMRPSWHNEKEVDAVISALSLLKTHGKKPSLAILSPYMEQVRRIRTALRKAQDAGKLNLSQFSPAIGGTEFCGTVDSFQGGQADCVVVSLVRNNESTNPSKSLGFLTRSHRMNVLLSRAKWRMVLIGSLDFYKYVLSNEDLPDVDLGFFRKFYKSVTEAPEAEISIHKYAALLEARS